MVNRWVYRALVLLIALGRPSGMVAQSGAAWPEADKLFHSNPLWLGSDAAFSIDLGGGRVLWMFNDTWVARTPGGARSKGFFVRNTVGVEAGYDPSHATIKFYWGKKHNRPAEIFASEGPVWMWPASGIRVGAKLLLFCERVAPDKAKDSLGFKSAGWEAYWVANPDAEPSGWKLTVAARSEETVILGSQALREGGYIYLFGESEPEHDLYAARLHIEGVERGEFGALEWWSGKEWAGDVATRQPIIRSEGTEASVQRDPRGDGFIEVNSDGFGATDIVMRRAPRIEGPWSEPVKIYRPPESDGPRPFVYAGKSHAELQGADLILTYATNSFEDKDVDNMGIYFPRFVKVDLRKVQ
jgi:Domain of unknown function (DUF4185)